MFVQDVNYTHNYSIFCMNGILGDLSLISVRGEKF